MNEAKIIRELVKISDFLYSILAVLPAKLADIKHTMLPTTNALMATDVIRPFLLGAIAPKAPISIPKELGFAKPQMANVAIPALRACNYK